MIPTTLVDILRAGTTDAYGDVVDDNGVAVQSGVPAGRAAKRASSQTSAGSGPADLAPRSVRRDVWQLPPGTDVRKGDRLRDLADGSISAVDTVLAVTSMLMPADVQVETVDARGDTL